MSSSLRSTVYVSSRRGQRDAHPSMFIRIITNTVAGRSARARVRELTQIFPIVLSHIVSKSSVPNDSFSHCLMSSSAFVTIFRSKAFMGLCLHKRHHGPVRSKALAHSKYKPKTITTQKSEEFFIEKEAQLSVSVSQRHLEAT